MNPSLTIRARRFVWFDIMTPDVGASLAFYAPLLGWRGRETDMRPGGSYTMVSAGGRDIGGLVPLGPGETLPSHWIAYVAVEDLGTVMERIAEAGGNIPVPPTDISGIGRFAVVLDPYGAALSPFERTGGQATEGGPPVPGSVVWNELRTPDPAGAGAFYRDAFGWTVSERTGGGAPLWIFSAAGAEIAGMSRMPPEADYPSHWLPHLLVPDAVETAEEARKHGGTVLSAPDPTAGRERAAILRDPLGAVFAVREQPAT